KKKADRVLSLEHGAAGLISQNAVADFEMEDGAAPERSHLLLLAEEVQDAVRRRAGDRTWQVFWDIAVLGQPIRATADGAGISYYAAFAAQKRVGRMLRETGERLLAEECRLSLRERTLLRGGKDNT